MRHILIVLVSIPLLTLPFFSQVVDIDDPEAQVDLGAYTCAQHIEVVELEDGRGDVRTVWAHGYYSAMTGVDADSAPLSGEAVGEFAERLDEACRERPQGLFINVLRDLATE